VILHHVQQSWTSKITGNYQEVILSTAATCYAPFAPH